MDTDLNLYYEKDGIPLNILEVHNERYENKPTRIKIITGYPILVLALKYHKVCLFIAGF